MRKASYLRSIEAISLSVSRVRPVSLRLCRRRIFIDGTPDQSSSGGESGGRRDDKLMM
jgi:hypothetical protein